jgi:ABC-2 type transport system ATP-binding protein
VREGTTLLLTTQYLEEADELADTIGVVDHGRIIASGTADQLKAQVGGERVEVVVHDASRLAQARDVVAAECRGDATVQEHVRRITAPTQGGAAQLVVVIRALDNAGIVIDDIGLRRPTLDDVFLTLTGHKAEQEVDDEAESGAGTGTTTPAGRAS